jgi:hypothetical protein
MVRSGTYWVFRPRVKGRIVILVRQKLRKERRFLHWLMSGQVLPRCTMVFLCLPLQALGQLVLHHVHHSLKHHPQPPLVPFNRKGDRWRRAKRVEDRALTRLLTSLLRLLVSGEKLTSPLLPTYKAPHPSASQRPYAPVHPNQPLLHPRKMPR